MRRLVLVLAIVLVAVPAFAEDASTRSVEKANAGLSEYEQGKWDEALRLFREAESLYHSPVYVLYAARTLGRSGRWRDARREYDRLLSEALPADAPEAFRKARAEARIELDTLEREMPTLVVSVVGASKAARVTVDGERVMPGQPIELDPGSHEVRARDGDRVAVQTLLLLAGKKAAKVTLTFPALKPARKPPAEERRINRTGIVVGGAGAVLGIAGGVVGLLALDRAGTARDGFPDSCNGNTCPVSKRSAIEDDTRSARTLGSVSTGLFIGAGVAIATGVVLILVDPGAKPKRTSASLVRF